jgi:hypothetical protein
MTALLELRKDAGDFKSTSHKNAVLFGPLGAIGIFI